MVDFLSSYLWDTTLAGLRYEMPATIAHEIETTAAVLEEFANRGVFRGFSRGNVRAGRCSFKLLWHRDRLFEVIVDPHRRRIRIPVVLPDVPAGSCMFRDFREFVLGRQSTDIPEHRRIEISKAALRCTCTRGNAGVSIEVLDSDYDYATRKLVHAVHEVFLVFLYDGRFYDYLVSTFDLDPDKL